MKRVSVLAVALACGSPPEETTSFLLLAAGLHQPAGHQRDCVRFLEKSGDRSRFHHWECSRRTPFRGPGDPGPWTEERVIFSPAGRVKQVERTWVMPDTVRWIAAADSIGASFVERGAQEVRCDWAARTRVGLRTWYLDSVFVMLQAHPFPFGPGVREPPIRFELHVLGRARGAQTCIPVVALPNPRMQPTGRRGRRAPPGRYVPVAPLRKRRFMWA